MVSLPLVHISWAIEPERRKACDAFFQEIFGAQTLFEILVTPENDHEGFDRDESLLLIADSMLIPVAPAGGGKVQGSPVGDMLRKATGEGIWLGIALRVENLDSADRWFRSRGVIPHYDPGQEQLYCMIRRKETLGVRVELIKADIPGDPRAQPGWSPSWWSEAHPLGIEGIASIGVSVTSLDDAEAALSRLWEWPVLGRRAIPLEDAVAQAFLMGDCVLEAMQPRSAGSSLADHAEAGRGIYCICYKVRSLEVARDYLAGKGIHVTDIVEGRFAIDMADSFGRLLHFTDQNGEGYPIAGAPYPRCVGSF